MFSQRKFVDTSGRSRENVAAALVIPIQQLHVTRLSASHIDSCREPVTMSQLHHYAWTSEGGGRWGALASLGFWNFQQKNVVFLVSSRKNQISPLFPPWKNLERFPPGKTPSDPPCHYTLLSFEHSKSIYCALCRDTGVVQVRGRKQFQKAAIADISSVTPLLHLPFFAPYVDAFTVSFQNRCHAKFLTCKISDVTSCTHAQRNILHIKYAEKTDD